MVISERGRHRFGVHKKGTINANGKDFKIEHLHGVRPFANDAQMRALQKELTQRVAQWVDNETPYCLFREPGGRFCLSCGDFVVRILYPGTNPLIPALPRDFSHRPGAASTTDDLLLYLVGIYNLPDKHAKLARLAVLDLPANMREDIITMIEDSEPDARNATVATTPRPHLRLLHPHRWPRQRSPPEPESQAGARKVRSCNPRAHSGF